jgi:hypothetical protein
MGKYIIASMMIACSHLTGGVRGPVEMDHEVVSSQELIVKQLAELSESELKAFMHGGGSHIVLQLNEGDQFPLTFSLSGDVLDLQHGGEANHLVRLKQTLFLRNDGDLYISTDLSEWVDALDFFTGTAGVSIHQSHRDPRIELYLDANKR